MYCDTCVHWMRQEYAGGAWGTGKLAENQEGSGRYMARTHDRTKAYAEGASGYDAWLVTAVDFGCVQFKETNV